MHMADALVSPAVGGTMWAAAAGLIGCASRSLRKVLDDRTVPLMGVLGAFVFTAQMINFAIPGTGSSGHIGGGLLLAILLGPHAAFLTLASVLVIQALFFADGGLLALGCNIVNLGLFPCYLAYPWVYRPLAGGEPGRGRIAAGAITASVAGLQLGALAVVLETCLSGIADLPPGKFLLLMQPIHLAIGVVEGVATAAVVVAVRGARPDVLRAARARASAAPRAGLVPGLLAAALLAGGVASWFASAHPDGLEWSILGVTGGEEIAPPAGGAHGALAGLQARTAVLPGYGLPPAAAPPGEDTGEARPAIDPGTSLAGVVGAGLTLLAVGGVGLVLRRCGTA
jgi:cobalt/nickel transport system permease protein